jgi:Cu-Zn family superoxide dismutase
MRFLLSAAALIAVAAAPAFAQTTRKADLADTATVVRVDPAGRVITITNDVTGREERIGVDASTRVQIGAETVPLTRLAPGDRVAITARQAGGTPTDTPIADLVQVVVDEPGAATTPPVGAAPAAAVGAGPDASTMTATLVGRDGKQHGEVRVRETQAGLLVDLDLNGLPPGTHAFHVHAVGRCEPPFESAGDHLAMGKSHGFLANGGPHPGDFPNLEVGSDGRVRQTLRAPDLRLTDVHDADGAAFVLHAGADDYTSQPSGNSGDRIACAAIAATGGAAAQVP